LSDEPATTQESEEEEKSQVDNRHLMRQYIIQRLYQWDYQQKKQSELVAIDDADLLDDLELEDLKISGKLRRKVNKFPERTVELIKEVQEASARLDAIIQKYAVDWPVENINPVDLQILRLAILEGFEKQEIPAKVAINEAIELSKDFGLESNEKFVSGVLGSIYNERKDELKDNIEDIQEENGN
jgi:N utilization substance protein B